MELLSFIKEFIQHNEYAPTVREIAEHFGISVRGVQDHLTALIRKRFIKNQYRKPRTMIILEKEP
jgi:repressor LexA